MVETKPVDKVVNKWRDRASIASTEYAENAIENASKWLRNLKENKKNWKDAMQEVLSKNLWEQAIDKLTEQDYVNGIKEKGANRYSDGINKSVDKYQERMTKVLQFMQGIKLPPRGPKGSDQNFERVKVLGKALHDAKVKGLFK